MSAIGMVLAILLVIVAIIFILRAHPACQLSWGNYIDMTLSMYSLCQRSTTCMRTLQTIFLPNQGLFVDPAAAHRYITSDATAHPQTLSILASNWAASDPSLVAVLPFIRELQFQKIASADVSIEAARQEVADACIVHIRLADTPFMRQPMYRLYTVRWYLDAIIAARQRVPFTRVLLMSCFTHRADSKAKSIMEAIMRVYRTDLETHLVQVCAAQGWSRIAVDLRVGRTEVEDVCALMTAPAVVSNCSSFSYYAALCGSGVWVTTDPCIDNAWSPHNLEQRQRIEQLRPGVVYLPPHLVAHSAVADYYDVDEVVRHLRAP